MTVVVHLARHAQVASHRGDVPLTAAGVDQSRELGLRVATWCTDGERVGVLHADSRRATETAVAAHDVLAERLGAGADLAAPREQPALRNPDVYLAGWRVDMGSSPQAVADQVPGRPVDGEDVPALGFWREWFADADRVGMWVAASDPRGEDAATVARRIVAWASSLRDIAGADQRVLAVTHSTNLRALLLRCFGADPGEPGFTEVVTLRLDDGGDGARVCWRDQESRVSVPS